MRACMAKTLLAEPDILLLDEPSANLDIEGLIWLENYLKTCRIPVIFFHGETDDSYSKDPQLS